MTARNATNGAVAGGELIGGGGLVLTGGVGAIRTGNPGWLAVSILGGYMAYKGYEGL